MILFDLRCAQGHGFEAWFRDGASYEAQVAEGAVACPVCGGTEVAKAIMAPALAHGGDEAGDRERARRRLLLLRAVHRHVEKHFDPVGSAFAEEARKIHHGEVEARNIYGEATPEQAKELHDEGVRFGMLSRLPPENA